MFLFSVGTLLINSCGEPVAPEKYSHPGWNTLVFEGWSIQAPEGFKLLLNGKSDSESATIISAKDSFEIHINVWKEPDADYEDCADDELEQNHESSIDWCEEFYHAGSEHTVWTKTVNGRYAVLTRPITAGTGTVSIHFSDCHHSLAMSAVDLTKEQEEVVLEMFATIDWK